MASEEHLAILKQGVEAWNAWRRANPDAVPHLMQANLNAANLKGADFSLADLTLASLIRANLSEATLSRADLGRAYLTRANLTRADLSGAYISFAKLDEANLSLANLGTADLGGADLSGANLTGARLGGAFLSYANLTRARLATADLTGAVLAGTTLVDTDLTGASGLDSCRHLAPSSLDFPTLQRSHPLPLSFLRGCGLPDALIDALPSPLAQRTYHSCFISYSTKDQNFASHLYADLQSNGVRCWYAPHDIQAGKTIHEQIRKAIGEQDRLLLVLSEHSMSAEWVKTEIAEARHREATQGTRMLFPIRLVDFERIKHWQCFDADTGKDSAREIREYFIPDFQHWQKPAAYRQALDRLLRDLRAPTAPSHPPEGPAQSPKPA